MDPPGVLIVASITVDLKSIFEEGKYCAYDVCKHCDYWSKTIGC